MFSRLPQVIQETRSRPSAMTPTLCADRFVVVSNTNHAGGDDRMGTATLAPAAVPGDTATDHERPHIRAVLRHLALSVLMANVVPSVLFYLCMVVGNVWMALVAALLWCYGSMASRLSTKR